MAEISFLVLQSVSQSRFIEKPELVKPEMRGNSEFLISQSQLSVAMSHLPRQPTP